VATVEEDMKFSLILPAHNAADRIRKTLDSVKCQLFTDYELIVVCDACEDNTASIAREYGAIVEEVDFRNPGPTRSRGLDIASGEWILFMDDDDWWLHEFAFEQINDNLGDEDLLCFGFIWKYRGYAAPLRKNKSLWPAPWNKAWRRSAIGDTRFPEEYPDDYLFHCAMMNKHPRLRFLDMPLYYYNYWRPGSISVQKEPDLRKRQL
jgi:glycosyltransferase involved in cell wall biosynthesis